MCLAVWWGQVGNLSYIYLQELRQTRSHLLFGASQLTAAEQTNLRSQLATTMREYRDSGSLVNSCVLFALGIGFGNGQARVVSIAARMTEERPITPNFQ